MREASCAATNCCAMCSAFIVEAPRWIDVALMLRASVRGEGELGRRTGTVAAHDDNIVPDFRESRLGREM